MDKEQRKLYNKEYYEKNKDKIKEYYEKNKDKIKEYYEKNKDKIKEVNKEYREKNKDKIKEVNKEYREKNKDKIRADRIMRKYNLTMEDYQEIINSQNNQCPICHTDLRHVKLHVDHDHETGKVRGILCYKCNTQLGVYEKLNGFASRINSYLNNGSPKSLTTKE